MIHTRSCRVQIYNILLSNGRSLMKNHFDWSLLLKIILQCRLDLTEVTDGMGMTDITDVGLLVLFLVVGRFEGGIYDAFETLGDVAVSGPILGPR